MATYPVYPATTFTQAVELTIFASNQLHDVINGDALTTVETENGDVPTLRKALVDNFYFKTPINWVEGESSTVFNQLYYFDGNLATSGWYYAPQATVDNPVAMGSTPLDDDNWRLYQTAKESIPAQVYPWYTEITETVTSVSPPYEFDTAIVVLNGVVLTPTKDYTISDNKINFTSTITPEPDAETPDILFCYIGKVEEGNAATNYVTYNSLAASTAAGLIGTSTGTTVEEALDPTLRQELGSSEIPGAGIVMLGQKVTVQQAMNYLLNKGNAVRLSPYYLLNTNENNAFAAALEDAKDADGYVCRVIVNDTGRPVKLTERFLFQSVESTSVLGGTYNENLCGVVGEFELANGAGFDFISCYSPFINIVVTDGGGNSVDAATPLNSDFAVRMEQGVIAPEFHITGYEYEGYLFGSTGSWNGVAAPGVQCVHKSSLAAFGGAAALYVKGTTGFGNITSVWEEGVTHYSLIDTAYDVQIASYENFIPAAGAGQLTLRSCGSLHIGKLLTGAWGIPQVKIFDCPSVDIGTHLSVLGNSDVNTEETYAADICGSVVHIGSVQLLKLGSGYRVGHGASLTIDNINGNILNQAVSQTNNTTYDGASTSTSSSVTIKSARFFRGNSNLTLSSKDMFYVDPAITSGKLELESIEVLGLNYGRTSDYARLVNVLSQNANFKVYLDGIAVDYVGTTLPFYIYNYLSLVKSIGLFFTGEIQFSTGNSKGNGKTLQISSGLNIGGGTTTYSGRHRIRVYLVGNIATGGSFSIVRGGLTVFLSSAVGQFATNFDVYPGDSLVVSNTNTTVSSSWAEVQFN